MSEEELLTRYYLLQAGSGMGDFYSGPIYQRGYGIGSFLGGLFRRILPLLKKSGIAVGKEMLSSGMKFANDLENNVDPRAAFKSRVTEGINNLKRKAMSGDGYKAHLPAKRRYLPRKGRAVQTKRLKKKSLKKRKPVRKNKTNKKLKKKKTNDIFS